MQSSEEFFLTLVRLGIGHNTKPLSQIFYWQDIKALADKQGLSAVIVDGIERMPESNRPPQDAIVTMDWRSLAIL